MKKARAALGTAAGVVVGVIVLKIIWDLFSADPAGAGHKVKEGYNTGVDFLSAIETFVREGGWAALLVLVAVVVFVIRLIRS